MAAPGSDSLADPGAALCGVVWCRLCAATRPAGYGFGNCGARLPVKAATPSTPLGWAALAAML